MRATSIGRIVAGAIIGATFGWIGGWIGGCGAAGGFLCSADSQCTNGRAQGRCEDAGWCSFEDTQCASGRRYGDRAGDGLANLCVAQSVAEDSDASQTGGSGAASETGVGTVGFGSTQGDSTADSTGGIEPDDDTGTSTGAGTDRGDATGPLICRPGFEDCDGVPDNGCEADLGDPATCGSCDKSCVLGTAALQCASATCSGTVELGVQDTRVQDNGPDTNFNNANELLLDAGPNVYEALIVVPELSLLPLGATVTMATLELTCTDPGGDVDVRVVQEDWDVTTVTWNTKPSVDAAVFAAFDPSPGPIVINLTEVVQGWADGTANYGVHLSTDGGGSDYHSSEATNAAVRPYLALTVSY